MIALDAGVIVGHAMAADRAGPGPARTTDVGVVVADRWQGRGVGSVLVRELFRRAAGRGVHLGDHGRAARQSQGPPELGHGL